MSKNTVEPTEEYSELTQFTKGNCPFNFVFTINNWTHEILETLRAITPEDNQFLYICWAQEVASTGTPHLQGYAELKRQCKFAPIRDRLSASYICARAPKATGWHAITYCQKGDVDKNVFRKQLKEGKAVINPTWESRGEAKNSEQGKRTDVHDLIDAIQSGATTDAIKKEHMPTIARMPAGFQLMLSTLKPKPTKIKPLVHWFWGASGRGKTSEAYRRFELDRNDPRVYKHNMEEKWWPNYDSEIQDIVLLDEYDSEKIHFGFNRMKVLLDEYDVHVEQKHGGTWFNPKYIFITSEHHPRHYFEDPTNPNKYEQIASRLTDITQLVGANMRKESKPIEFVIDNREPIQSISKDERSESRAEHSREAACESRDG